MKTSWTQRLMNGVVISFAGAWAYAQYRGMTDVKKGGTLSEMV